MPSPQEVESRGRGWQYSRYMTAESESDFVRFLKLHICSQLIILSKRYAPVIDAGELIGIIAAWWPKVSAGQKSKLVESLTLLSNHFPARADQAALLAQVLSPSLAFFADAELTS